MPAGSVIHAFYFLPQSISGITSPVLSVAFNNSENWIGAGSKSGIIKVFDLAGNRGESSKDIITFFIIIIIIINPIEQF